MRTTAAKSYSRVIRHTARYKPATPSLSTTRGGYAAFNGCKRTSFPPSSKNTRLNVVSWSGSKRTKQSHPSTTSASGENTTTSPSRYAGSIESPTTRAANASRSRRSGQCTYSSATRAGKSRSVNAAGYPAGTRLITGTRLPIASANNRSVSSRSAASPPASATPSACRASPSSPDRYIASRSTKHAPPRSSPVPGSDSPAPERSRRASRCDTAQPARKRSTSLRIASGVVAQSAARCREPSLTPKPAANPFTTSSLGVPTRSFSINERYPFVTPHRSANASSVKPRRRRRRRTSSPKRSRDDSVPAADIPDSLYEQP